MTKVFLGGTTPSSDPMYGWRGELIPQLKIESFNPVVDDWTPAHIDNEIKQRNLCDYCLYVITPEMKGVYAIAEVVDDSNKKPEKTILCVLDSANGARFTEGEMRSLASVGKMVEMNGGKFLTSLNTVAEFLNVVQEEQ